MAQDRVGKGVVLSQLSHEGDLVLLMVIVGSD